MIGRFSSTNDSPLSGSSSSLSISKLSGIIVITSSDPTSWNHPWIKTESRKLSGKQFRELLTHHYEHPVLWFSLVSLERASVEALRVEIRKFCVADCLLLYHSSCQAISEVLQKSQVLVATKIQNLTSEWTICAWQSGVLSVTSAAQSTLGCSKVITKEVCHELLYHLLQVAEHGARVEQWPDPPKTLAMFTSEECDFVGSLMFNFLSENLRGQHLSGNTEFVLLCTKRTGSGHGETHTNILHPFIRVAQRFGLAKSINTVAQKPCCVMFYIYSDLSVYWQFQFLYQSGELHSACEKELSGWQITALRLAGEIDRAIPVQYLWNHDDTVSSPSCVFCRQSPCLLDPLPTQPTKAPLPVAPNIQPSVVSRESLTRDTKEKKYSPGISIQLVSKKRIQDFDKVLAGF